MEWTLFPAENFAEHSSDWDQLNSRSANTPLLDSRFVDPLIKNFGTGEELLAIGCEDERPQCMAIVVSSGMGRWQTFQPSQAPVGCWLQVAGTSVVTLGESLRRALPGMTLLLGITQQDPRLLPRPNSTSLLASLDYIDTASIPVKGSFEEYWSSRGKNLRQNLRRQRNRLDREDTNAKLVVIREADAMFESVKAYGDLESVGWKSASNTAINIDNAQGQFYSQMLGNFAKTGQAIVFQYWYDETMVATDLCIMDSRSLIILKTTYDENISTSSPAMLMRENSFEYVFDNGLVDNIEFYGKVMDWHTKWSSAVRTMYHTNIYSVLGSIAESMRRKKE